MQIILGSIAFIFLVIGLPSIFAYIIYFFNLINNLNSPYDLIVNIFIFVIFFLIVPFLFIRHAYKRNFNKGEKIGKLKNRVDNLKIDHQNGVIEIQGDHRISVVDYVKFFFVLLFISFTIYAVFYILTSK